MKKIVILIVVCILCAGGWAVATFVAGRQTEAHYHTLLQQNGQWGPVSLSSQGYRRGFLCSRAETLLEVSVPVAAADSETPSIETLQLVFEHTLHHGPLPFTGPAAFSPLMAWVETRLVRIPTDEDGFARLLQDVPELREAVAYARIGLSGETDSHLVIPAFDKQTERLQISWGGLTTDVRYAPGDKTLDGRIDMPSMALRFDDGGLSWDGLTGQFDLVEALPLLYVGSSRMMFGAMQVDFPEEQDGRGRFVRIQPVEAVSESRIQDGLVSYDQVMTFNGLTVDDESFGPLVIDVETRNLDGQTLSAFQGEVLAVYREIDAFDPDQVTARLLPLYVGLLSDLLAGNPELNIRRLHVTTPMGAADGTLRVACRGIQGLDPDNPATLLAAVQRIDAAADLVADEDLVRTLLASSMKSSLQQELKAAQAVVPDLEYSEAEIDQMVRQQLDEQLGMLVAQNFVEREAGRLKTRASFRNGLLTVNGQELPFLQGR